MKRIGLWMLMLVVCISFGKAQTKQDVKKVAILEVVDRTNEVQYGVKLLLRTTLSKVITQTAGYEGYDRVDMGAIQGEQDFQRTGMVSDAEIKKLGEMTGAAYVLVAEVAKIDASHIVVTAKILNVETAKLERTDFEQTGISSQDMEKSCYNLANRLLRQSASIVPTAMNSVENITTTTNVAIQSKEDVVFKGCNLFWCDNNLHRTKMSDFEKQMYLGDHYAAYLKFVKNKKAGIGLTCAGVAIAVGGSMVGLSTSFGVMSIMSVVGTACLGSGIALWVIADKKIHRMVDDVEYSQRLSYQAKPVLSIESGQYGLGLNLRF